MATTARLVAVADALVAVLNAGTFETAFVARRVWYPQFSREELSTLQVCVVSMGDSREAVSRSAWQEDSVVDVGVAKAVVPARQVPETDTLAYLFQQIKDLLQYTSSAPRQLDGATWLSTENVSATPFWAQRYAEELHVWMAAARFTYRRVITS